MNSKLLSLLLAFLLAAWMAPPLGAQGAKSLAEDGVSGDTMEGDLETQQAEALQEKRMDASALLNMVAPSTDADLDTQESRDSARELAEQAAGDDDPVVSYYGAVTLARLDGRALPQPPLELQVEKEPIAIPAGASFTEPSDWEAFVILTAELGSDSVDDRLRAINGLINLAYATRPGPAPEVIFELQALLTDEEPQVAQMASHALNGLVPAENRLPNTKALGRLTTEDELFALVDTSLGEGGESYDQRLQAMEALLEAAMQTPLAEDPEVLRAFETSATDTDPRIAYYAQLALHGGLAGDPDALAGTWVAPADPHRQVDFSDQPPSFNDDAPVPKRAIGVDEGFTGVYVNPDPQPFEPGDQPPSPDHREEIATYEEVAPNVWVNTAPPQRAPDTQQQPE